MNVNCINKDFNFRMKSYLNVFRIDPALYKFCSIILAIAEVQVACKENRLVTWLNSDKIQNIPDIKTYRSVVFPLLRLGSESNLQKYKNKMDVAKRYAHILAQYVPDDKGCIGQKFSYYQLVSVIEKVFKRHIKNDEDLFYSGLKISIDRLNFYAKVEAQQIFIFSSSCKVIGEGKYGTVREVYDIASQQLFALKWAKQKEGSLERIEREIVVLKKLQALADFEESDIDWLQDAPLAAFYLPGFLGFLGTKYGINLYSWGKEDHSNEERFALCGAIVRAFVAKENFGYMHGDFKLENIVVGEKGAVIIDWDGSKSYLEVFNMDRPDTITTINIRYLDLLELDSLEVQRAKSCKTDDLSMRYLEKAKSMELFSLATVLFYVLVSEMPFEDCYHKEYEAYFPITEYGICEKGLHALIKRKYDWNIVLFIGKMLSHYPDNRYKLDQVIKFWGINK